jgi:hypothetical protein
MVTTEFKAAFGQVPAGKPVGAREARDLACALCVSRESIQVMRYIFIPIGLGLVLYAAAKVYLVFHHPNVGPALMADATLGMLGAILCFAAFVKTKGKKLL